MRKRWRLLLIVLVGALLIGGALASREFWFYLPAGEGPAGPAVSREPFQQAWTEREVLLLGVGDSVTAGYGASAGRSYFDRLVKNPDDEFAEMRGICLSAALPNLRSENLAISGSTSLHHLDILRESLPQQDAKTLGLVVMTTGGNDLIHNYGRSPPREGAMYGAAMAQAKPWIAAFEKRLDAMFDLLNARFPGGCQVFVADIYDPTDGVGEPGLTGLPPWPDGLEILGAYNDAIRRTAAKRPNVHVVPMHREFLGHGIYCRQPWREHYRAGDPHYWYADNIEDPNERGYDAIRRLFLIEMAKAAPQFRGEPRK